MTNEELLPCPFCGGTAEIIDIEDGENAGGSCVCCTKCNASSNLEFGNKENFVSNWNTRAELARRSEPAEVPEPVARLLRYAGKQRKDVVNPDITARDAIAIADWIAARGVKP